MYEVCFCSDNCSHIHSLFGKMVHTGNMVSVERNSCTCSCFKVSSTTEWHSPLRYLTAYSYLLLCCCTRLRAGPAPPSRLQYPVSRAQGCTSKSNNPDSKAKLAENPSVLHKGLAQWDLNYTQARVASQLGVKRGDVTVRQQKTTQLKIAERSLK